jgi:hypothetical protein
MHVFPAQERAWSLFPYFGYLQEAVTGLGAVADAQRLARRPAFTFASLALRPPAAPTPY